MNRKKPKGSISVNIVFDLEDETLMDYIWDEDHPQPPIIKPKLKKKDAKEKRGPS